MKAAICLPNKEENTDWGFLTRIYLAGFKVKVKVKRQLNIQNFS